MEKITNVRLHGYQTSRQIVETEDKVLFEVAESATHCGICASRIAHVKSVIATKKLDVSFVARPTQYGMTQFAVMPKNPSGQDVRMYVKELLDLPIII